MKVRAATSSTTRKQSSILYVLNELVYTSICYKIRSRPLGCYIFKFYFCAYMKGTLLHVCANQEHKDAIFSNPREQSSIFVHNYGLCMDACAIEMKSTTH